MRVTTAASSLLKLRLLVWRNPGEVRGPLHHADEITKLHPISAVWLANWHPANLACPRAARSWRLFSLPQLLLLRTAAVACDVFLARALGRDGAGRFRFTRLPRGTPQHRSVYRATTLAHECVLRTRLGFIERSSPSRLIVPIATLPLALCTCFRVYARGRRRGWRAARGRRGGGAGAARGWRGGCAWAALGRRGVSRA